MSSHGYQDPRLPTRVSIEAIKTPVTEGQTFPEVLQSEGRLPSPRVTVEQVKTTRYESSPHDRVETFNAGREPQTFLHVHGPRHGLAQPGMASRTNAPGRRRFPQCLSVRSARVATMEGPATAWSRAGCFLVRSRRKLGVTR